MCTIYIVVIPHLALRNYVALLDLTCRCESAKHTPRGEGRYGLIYCSRRNFRQLENPQHPLHFIRRAVSTHLLPRQIPHGVISARQHYPSDLYPVCLSVRLIVSPSHISQRELPRAYTHTETYGRRHVDFYLRLPLSRCAEILSWITINLSQ